MSTDPALWRWDLARQRCLREARRILGNRDDAEEAVQEAFIRAWRKRSACRTPATPLPWLLQITRNASMPLAPRRTPRQAPEVPEADPEAVPAAAPRAPRPRPPMGPPPAPARA